MEVCKSLSQVISCCANKAGQDMSRDAGCMAFAQDKIEPALIAWRDMALLHGHKEGGHGGKC
jgi:hypothetical protein